MSHCVGLFGTCGKSTWRNEVMKSFEDNNVEFFNPMVEHWTPECAEVEARHLATDSVIALAITNETTAIASLAEVGFSVASIINKPRSLVVFIDHSVDIEKAGTEAAHDSNRARMLVLAHLREGNWGNVFVVSSIEELTNTAIMQYHKLKNNAIHRTQFLTY